MLILSDLDWLGKVLARYVHKTIGGIRPLAASNATEFRTSNPTIDPDTILIVRRWSPENERQLWRELDQITNFYNKSKLIIYCDYPLGHAQKILRKGVQGYLTQNATLDDLKMCLSNVRNEKRFVEPDVIASLMGHFLPEDDQTVRNRLATLTIREIQVARMLAQNQTQTVIADKISLSTNTVSEIKAAIFRKLNIANIAMLQVMVKKLEALSN